MSTVQEQIPGLAAQSAATTPAHADLRAQMFAAKFAADTILSEPPVMLAPTDDNLTAAFKHCVRQPKAALYPAIRMRLASEYGLTLPVEVPHN